MNRIIFGIVCLTVLQLSSGRAAAQRAEKTKGNDFLKYVNTFVGTDDVGNTFPGASLPFGMVQLSPDNGAIGQKGYRYDHETIFGFSHAHMSGTGLGASARYANILFLPVVGPLNKEGNSGDIKTNYQSRFSHKNEEAHPGFYRVFLDDYKINAELTTTERVGMHRYTFPETSEAKLIIDLCRSPQAPVESFIEKIGNNIITGYTKSIEREGNVPFMTYFYAELSEPFQEFGTYNSGEAKAGQSSTKGAKGIGAFATFKQLHAGEQIIVKVGISFTGIEGAKKNMLAEIPGWDFDKVKANAENVWRTELAKIQVSGSTNENKEKFYTGLYHALLFPRVFSDADGSYYSHFKDSIYQNKQSRYYVDLSLWDTYRAVHPLFILIEPERQIEIVNTMLAMYDQGGRIPLHVNFRNIHYSGMIGDHGSTVILDSYLKGLRGFDIQKAYKGMLKNALEPGPDASSREGLTSYLKLGYVAADETKESVSETLEDCFTDWGIAQIAKELGKTEDYNTFMKRAHNYTNLYDSSIRLIRPRLSNGNWLPLIARGQSNEAVTTNGTNQYYSTFDPWLIGRSPYRHFTESNAFQYLWYVPHDVRGLINLMGGREKFVDRLDQFFTLPSSNSGPMYGGVTGVIGQYVHGNEPSHHTSYLYDYAGAPWKTQLRVREIMETKYGVDSRGLSGNDDMGQMSAWYVFSALGFYPVAPGQPSYAIGSPLFQKAEVDLGPHYGNKKFVVIANNVSGDNKYIQSAIINGKPLTKPWITHSDIINGGKLIFEMGPDPNTNWGTGVEDAPPSMTQK